MPVGTRLLWMRPRLFSQSPIKDPNQTRSFETKDRPMIRRIAFSTLAASCFYLSCGAQPIHGADHLVTAEIPANSASSLHRIWLMMLTNVKPETVRRGILYIDGTMEIFTASDGGNRELHGAAANEYPKKGRVSDLISLAFLLQAYCDLPPQGHGRLHSTGNLLICCRRRRRLIWLPGTKRFQLT